MAKVYISASTLNQISKCPLTYVLKRSPEGKRLMQEKGKSFALVNGSILHATAQHRDLIWSETGESPDLMESYLAAYEEYFTNPREVQEDSTAYWHSTFKDCLMSWLSETDSAKAKIAEHKLNTTTNLIGFGCPVRTPFCTGFLNTKSQLEDYFYRNPFDPLVKGYKLKVEEKLVLETDTFVITAYKDETWDGEFKYVKEIKSSKVEYTPADCNIDNQMTLYAVLENILNDHPLDKLFMAMHQTPQNQVTLTQRTDKQVDSFLQKLYAYIEVLENPNLECLGVCGTNSYAHSQLMCDYKEICPVWASKDNPATVLKGDSNVRASKKR